MKKSLYFPGPLQELDEKMSLKQLKQLWDIVNQCLKKFNKNVISIVK